MPYDTGTFSGSNARIGWLVAGAAMVVPALARRSLGRVLLAAGGLALLQRGLTGRFAPFRPSGPDVTLRRPVTPHDAVQIASEDSFPASDPPAWTPVGGALRGE